MHHDRTPRASWIAEIAHDSRSAAPGSRRWPMQPEKGKLVKQLLSSLNARPAIHRQARRPDHRGGESRLARTAAPTPRRVLTITADNGTEFRRYGRIEARINGEMTAGVSPSQCNTITEHLNHRSRKGHASPINAPLLTNHCCTSKWNSGVVTHDALAA